MAIRQGHLRFGLDFGTLMFGAGAGEVIAMLTIPALTRLFTPGHFGSAAFYFSLVAFLAPFASLRYEQAIVLPRHASESRQLLMLTEVLALAIGALFLAGIGAWDLTRGLETAARGVGRWLYLLPLGVFLTVMSMALALARTREKRFGTISVSNVAGTSTRSLAGIGLGAAFGSSVGGLVVAAGLGDLARVGILRWFGRGTEEAAEPVRVEDLKHVAGEYKDFAIYGAPTAVLNRFSAQMPVFLLVYLFGPAILGLYALSIRAIKAPLDLAAQQVRRVFVQRASARLNQGRSFADLYLWLSLVSLGSLLVPLSIVYVFADGLFVWVFSDAWAGAAPYARALVPWLLVVVPMSLVNGVFYVKRRLGWWLVLQVALIAGRSAALVSGYLLEWNPIRTVALFAWVSLVFYVGIALAGLILSAQGPGAAPRRTSDVTVP